MSHFPLISLPGGIELLILVLPALLCIVLWIWALIDILNNTFREKDLKIIWVLIILFLPFFGAILYFIIGRRQRLV